MPSFLPQAGDRPIGIGGAGTYRRPYCSDHRRGFTLVKQDALPENVRFGNIAAVRRILASTVGRIAHEVPSVKGSYGQDGRFMTADKASEFFQKKS